jgi:hypothetical protein
VDAAALLAHGALVIRSVGGAAGRACGEGAGRRGEHSHAIRSVGGAFVAGRTAARGAAGDGGGEGAHARAILVPVGKGRGAVVSTRMQLEGQSSASLVRSIAVRAARRVA